MTESLAQAIHHTKDEKWRLTSNGGPRGYIQPHALEELWFHTGTICNLSCSFCLEGSKPGDNRLEQITLEDARPIMREALDLGAQQFSFTGGEPFVNKAFPDILAHALDHRPCLVLTNGTAPLRKRLEAIRALSGKPNKVRFRISLDSPDPAVHDAERGQGAFAVSLESMRLLHEAGFAVSVARLAGRDEDKEAVDAQYRAHLAAAGVPEDAPIIVFPDFLPPGSTAHVPEITENCMTQYHTAESRAQFMCAFSKMIVKKDGRMRVMACTLVDDDPSYDLGGSLTESMRYRIMLGHHRCFSCFSCGASCSER